MKNAYYFQTEQLSVGYQGEPLIRQIEMHVQRGEILTLIGPNGSGKSTILKSITKQLKLIAGTILLENQSLKELSGKELSKKMAVVLTERMRTELMSCADVVATGRYPYTGAMGILTKDDWEKVYHAMRLVHAEDLADRDFNAISDGQRQRILLARAICQEPEIIILDEPTSFLDIKHKLELLAILKRMVKEKQVAVIMSLHEIDLAEKISDRVMCIKGPYIHRIGTPEEVFTPDYIKELYELEKGSYNPLFGCVELETPQGEPQVFVIAGGGSGIPVFRQLQRAGIPFAAGILHENDIDYEVARALAVQVISEKAFEAISEETYQKAVTLIKKCPTVLCTVEHFGSMNEKNRVLKEFSQLQGIFKPCFSDIAKA